MTPTIHLSKRAEKSLDRMDRKTERRVRDAIKRMADAWPDAVNVIRLQDVDPPEHRLRVGEWRVRFRVDTAAGVIMVLCVLPRGKAYER